MIGLNARRQWTSLIHQLKTTAFKSKSKLSLLLSILLDYFGHQLMSSQKWYMDRARAMDAFSGQLHNCLSLLEFALRKGIFELQQFHRDVLYLHQVICSNDNDSKAGLHVSFVKWEDYADPVVSIWRIFNIERVPCCWCRHKFTG